MPAINFTVFKEKILDGSKTHTIRRRRKVPIKVGDRLCLLWQQRTPDCERLLETVCTDLQGFEIDEAGMMSLNGVTLDLEQATALAQADGFDNLREFLAFFESRYKLPFEDGVVIHWQP